ncbi:hypothetical protein WJ59_17975 [Burkholderia gladioli]|uniref:TetR/AcrR family transcriptional regulator n=1 Tax=Burkholderia gladioli TaxID=28095 RepID=UPI00075B7F56|nr:TetR/AcrR family transcriptional regulator [Burkholderia gladioli]KVM65519.1 hypothetical protein WJ59_17975 [Burkholderia gladioli]
MKTTKRALPAAANPEPAGASSLPAGSPSRRRRLPQQQRATHTVDVILDAAAGILEEQGFYAYNTNLVAERAGISIGSLYQYFRDKAAITEALIARYHASLANAVSMPQPNCLAPGAHPLRGWIEIEVRHRLHHRMLGRLLDTEAARLPPAYETRQLEAARIAILASCLGKPRIRRQPVLLRDICGIVLGMTDAAPGGTRCNSGSLVARVDRAVLAYLASGIRDRQYTGPC